MFINKGINGKNNICGKAISRLRIEMDLSQRELAEKMQQSGLDIDKNAIQRIESGQRFITDIELFYLCRFFCLKAEDLFDKEFTRTAEGKNDD